MRSDISLSSDIHCAFNFGSPRTLATSAAPCFGGDEYIGRTTSFTCESTASARLVRADEVKHADALTVEAEVLGEGLRQMNS